MARIDYESQRKSKEMNCKAKESRGVEPRSEGTVENRTDVKRISEDMTREATALHRADEQRNGTAAHRLVVEQSRYEATRQGVATRRVATQRKTMEREGDNLATNSNFNRMPKKGLPEQPCVRGCPDRKAGCAVTCEKWAAYLKARNEIYEKRTKEALRKAHPDSGVRAKNQHVTKKKNEPGWH